MALAVDSQESSGVAQRIQSDTGPLTWSFTNTAGDFLLVGIIVTCASGGTSSITSVTYGGDALTALGTGQLTSTNATLTQFYYRIAPKTGSQTLTVNYSVSGSFSGACLAAAITFSGAHQTVPLGSEVKASGSGTTSATGSISSAATSFLVAVVSEGSGNIPSAGASNTLSAALAGSGLTAGDNIGLEYFDSTGAGRDMQFTWTGSDTWGTVGVEVKEATAGNSSSVSPSISPSSSASASVSKSPSPSSSQSASPSPTPSSSPSPSPAGIVVMERTVFYYVD